MLFQDLSPHVNFLNDAAHLLSQASPQTSAFLMRRRNELLVENDVPISDAQRQHVCSSCGHILVPGQGDMLRINPDKTPRNKFRVGKQSQLQKKLAASTPSAKEQRHQARAAVSKVITCRQCYRPTRLEMEGPRPILRQRKAAQQAKSAALSTQPVTGATPAAASSTATGGNGVGSGGELAKTSANASSKKRAKNRKAGLQALLDQKQTSTSSPGAGFSLSDFLKK